MNRPVVRDPAAAKWEVRHVHIVAAVSAAAKTNRRAWVDTFEVAEALGRGLQIARDALRRATFARLLEADPPLRFKTCGATPRRWRIRR